MAIEVMECHARELKAIPQGWALLYLESLFFDLPNQYSFSGKQQVRNMAARMEIAKRALIRGNAIITPNSAPDLICQACPAIIPCFSKPL